jgi:hypothetical protein
MHRRLRQLSKNAELVDGQQSAAIPVGRDVDGLHENAPLNVRTVS